MIWRSKLCLYRNTRYRQYCLTYRITSTPSRHLNWIVAVDRTIETNVHTIQAANDLENNSLNHSKINIYLNNNYQLNIREWNNSEKKKIYNYYHYLFNYFVWKKKKKTGGLMMKRTKHWWKKKKKKEKELREIKRKQWMDTLKA